MFKYFNKLFRVLSKTPVALYLRQVFNFHPPAINLKYSEVSSDLFIWRDVTLWDTYFNIAHLGPILNPYYKENYNAIIEIFDSNGIKIASRVVVLVYGESNLLYINDLLEGCDKSIANGTFAVFHLANVDAMFNNEKICIAERGFVSYKRKSDSSRLRSYAHGNANAVAYSINKHSSRRLGVVQKTVQHYRFQLSLSDALYSEVALVNFLSSDTLVSIYQYKNTSKVKLTEIKIPSGGLWVLTSLNDFNPEFPIEFQSTLNFLRPVIFKYYENHFDVLHG